MRRVPCGSSATKPASLSSRRWRDTAGRLIGSAAAISCTERPPPLSRLRISRRLGSPSASNAVPAARSGTRLDALLEPGRELVERGLQVRHRLPDQPEQRAGVLLAHAEGGPLAVRREGVGALPAEQAERHAAGEDQAAGRVPPRDPPP